MTVGKQQYVYVLHLLVWSAHWYLRVGFINFDKTEALLQKLNALRSKLSDSIVTLDVLSVLSCAPVKDLVVIIDSNRSHG